MIALNTPAPEWTMSSWLNTSTPISLASLKGRVVVVHAFQMLCPGCVSHGLPQALAIRQAFSENEVAVIGIHTVFEHHTVMNEQALQAFVHEYKIRFPIGIDLADGVNDVPMTMQEYGMRGTPSFLLIDRAGVLRQHHFGRLDDLRAGAMIGQLLAESIADSGIQSSHDTDTRNCDENACSV
jgi:peroxiredoxin